MIRKAFLLALFLPIVLSKFVRAHTETEHHHGDIPSHMHASAEKESTKPTIKLSILKIEDKRDKKYVQIKFAKIKDGSPVTPDLLKEAHTRKVHLLIIDDSLTDYSHIHPEPTKEAGVYEFTWAPAKKDANYRVWADLLPVDTNAQEYATADLTTSQGSKAQIDRKVSMQSTVDGLTFKLSFDNSDLQAEKPSTGKVTITDGQGNPVNNLEPIMGAFAHIVGFNEDFQTIIHIHPIGKEPTKDSERGGRELQFHIEPEKAGFLKLFVQVRVNGKELFAPFGLMVRDIK